MAEKICSRCSSCNELVCTNSLCARLMYVPRLSEGKYVLICSRCVRSVDFEVGENGEGEGFFSLSANQMEVLRENPKKQCNSCSLEFSFFLQPFACSKCQEICCRRCCNLTLLGTNECGECFRNPGRVPSKNTHALLCDCCGLAILEEELIWLNMNKLHTHCLKTFKTRNAKICSLCEKAIIGDQSILLNEDILHDYCLPAYRKLRQQTYFQ